jgi:hypothetical protein
VSKKPGVSRRVTLLNSERAYEYKAPPAGGVRTTREIAGTLRVQGGREINHSVAVAGALACPDRVLPVDPYLLGAWLGDGTSAAAGMTIAEPEMADCVSAAAVSSGYTLRKRADRYGYGVVGGMAAALQTMGLRRNKHVPAVYLRASVDQRRALLQGLMDTDGYCDLRGQCELTTTCRALADGAVELILSLGCKAAVSEGVATLDGRVIGPKYRIKFLAPFPAFRLPRKLARQKTTGFRPTVTRRFIEAVEPVESVPVRCIEVDSPSRLYLVGRSMIPTHNSDYLLGDFAQDVGKGHGPAWRGLLIRRTFPQLRQLIARSKAIYGAWFPGASYVGGENKMWTFPGGETLTFRFLKREEDAENMQGDSYAWIGFDELGQFGTLAPWHMLKGTLRSPEGVPCVRMRGSANPGGRGHQAIKQYFGIDRFPGGNELIKDPVTGMSRMFIKSRVTDNRILMENDPSYVQKLAGTGSEALVRAWLEGDWDAIIGQYFDCWRSDLHVVKPFPLQEHWIRFRGYDWGYASPGCVQWWCAVGSDTWHPDGFLVPKGSIVCYREWYVAKPTGEGMRLPDEEIARGILARERDDPPARIGASILSDHKVNYSVADPSIWNQRPSGLAGPPIAETMAKSGVHFRPADNNRIAGWAQMRSRMVGIDGRPTIYFFDTCDAAIRTIPALPHDETDPEDADSEAEDHAADCCRYSAMSRPWMKPDIVAAEPMQNMHDLTIERLWQEHARDKQRRSRRPWQR